MRQRNHGKQFKADFLKALPPDTLEGIEKYLKENNLPLFNNDRKLYYNYENTNVLRVFNYDNFHSNIVNHLFSGQDADGWCQERFHKLV